MPASQATKAAELTSCVAQSGGFNCSRQDCSSRQRSATQTDSIIDGEQKANTQRQRPRSCAPSEIFIVARPKKQPVHATCHPDRPTYAHAICRQCYDSVRWRGQLPTSLSGEARRMAEEIAGRIPRAGRKRPEASEYLRVDPPKVAEFVATVAVKNALDMEKTVEEIKPELSPSQVASTAEKLENDPRVQQAIEK